MNLYKLDVEQIYKLANKVLSELGKQVQADVECWWTQYEDERILIHYGGGYYDSSFQVWEKQEDKYILVLETHRVFNRKITNKVELLRDMLYHGFCDSQCPGYTRAVPKRAYEIYLKRGREPHHELDDWLQAEAEILEELERKFSGDWEVATLEREAPWGPVPCVILRRGEWVEHLKSLASTL